MGGKPITVMTVHAHPDDEVVFTGGMLAAYGEKSIRTVLVTTTMGEEGEMHDPDLDLEEARPRLGEIRHEELLKAIDILGITDFEYLGYRDSGMAGTESNGREDNFHNADVEEATARLVKLVRRYRPEIVVTYDEFGAYGHPDHIKCNVITHLAFDRAGDPAYLPGEGEPWQPLKLYYTHWAEDVWMKVREMMLERGLKWPWDDEEQQRQDEDPEHQSTEEGVAEQIQEVAKAEEENKPPPYTPPPVTTRMDVREMFDKKREAMLVHRTQFSQEGLFRTMPEDIARLAFSEEHYSLVKSHVGDRTDEKDLLEGLD
jgi:LmbE family N-acetylglucosaminyl deacetylase